MTTTKPQADAMCQDLCTHAPDCSLHPASVGPLRQSFLDRLAPIMMISETSQYLAWGGECDGIALVTSADLVKVYETAHYAGIYMFDHLALVGVEDSTVLTRPVSITQKSRTCENDYITTVYTIHGDWTESTHQFTVGIDGRA